MGGKFKPDTAGPSVHPVKPLHGWSKYNRWMGYAVYGTDAAKQAAKIAKKRKK